MLSPPAEGQIRILMVDDDEDDYVFVRDLFADINDNYVLEWVSTYEQGLRTLVESRHDACLLDYQLDSHTGIELLEAAKALQCAVPIIFLSGLADREVDMRAMQAGAADFLVKALINAASLDRSIRYTLQQKQHEADLRRSRDDLENRVLERTVALEAQIAERLRAEAALRVADQQKNEFLAMLSHELRNPLAPILNSLELMESGRDDPAARDKARAVIERQVGQLARLVDDLLDVSRITTGRVRLDQQRVDMRSIVELAVETARPLIDSRRHQFKLDLPRDPLWVQADPTRLEQVVVNLLNNAAKYTDDGGRIELSLRTEGDWLSLAVTDTGLGIEPDMLPQIFDLFTQGSRSLDRSQGGLGIGLSLVQRLVEMHGGSVGAASGGLGKGSRFTVRLPLLGSSQPMTARAPVAPNKQPLPKCRVLVVDDNVDAAETMAMLAKISGHEVRIAHAGTTALEAAASFLPNVALLDIGLPGLDGYEVARRLRVNPKLRNLRLIAITGYGQQSDIDLAYEAGFHHHLVKPVQFSDMAKLLVGLDEVDTTSPIV